MEELKQRLNELLIHHEVDFSFITKENGEEFISISLLKEDGETGTFDNDPRYDTTETKYSLEEYEVSLDDLYEYKIENTWQDVIELINDETKLDLKQIPVKSLFEQSK